MLLAKEQIQMLIDLGDCTVECPPGKLTEHCGCSILCVKQITLEWGQSNEEREARFTKEEIAELDALYDLTNGFYEPGQGCRLPRKYRPIDCLRGYCDKAKQQLGLTDELFSRTNTAVHC